MENRIEAGAGGFFSRLKEKLGTALNKKLEEAGVSPAPQKEQGSQSSCAPIAQPAAQNIELFSPLSGTVIALTAVKDEAFSSEALGKGCAIVPEGNTVCAPCDGTVSVLPDTRHAIGITTDSGADVLIHIGMNTVELNGVHFDALVAEGARIKKGDELIRFELEALKALGYDTTTPVIISNADDYKAVSVCVPLDAPVNAGTPIIKAEK